MHTHTEWRKKNIDTREIVGSTIERTKERKLCKLLIVVWFGCLVIGTFIMRSCSFMYLLVCLCVCVYCELRMHVVDVDVDQRANQIKIGPWKMVNDKINSVH